MEVPNLEVAVGVQGGPLEGGPYPFDVAKQRDQDPGLCLSARFGPPNKLRKPDSKSAASERDLEDSVCSAQLLAK